MIAAGLPAEVVDEVVRMVDRSEYKRRQARAGDPDHDEGVRPRPAPADHQPVRRLAAPGSGLTAIVICARAQTRSSESRPPPPRPRWCCRGGGRAPDFDDALGTGRMKLTLIDCPIAAIPSPSTAIAVAREQTLSTSVDHTPPWMTPKGWSSSSRISSRARA